MGKLKRFSNFSKEVFGFLTSMVVSTETIPLNCGIEMWTKDDDLYCVPVLAISCPLDDIIPSAFCFLKLCGEFLEIIPIEIFYFVINLND